MAITAVQNEASASLLASINGTKKSSATDSTAELSDRFLKLLVTQLKNQDPTNPMQNAELTTQLAQMSTVEGVNKLNASLDGLVSQFKASQVMQGAALVGRQVLAEGGGLVLGAAGAAGGFSLDSAADSVKIRVFDASGAQVQAMDLGKQDAGVSRFVWDGFNGSGEAQAEGAYTFKVEASAAGTPLVASSYSLGSVLSVSLNDADMGVEVSGLGARRLDQIRQIF
jgi:flagellar basal-body rod modification protein FlgD